MNEQQKEQLRQILLELYGLDINEANCRFSTQNHAFIFPGQPHMIRVNMAQRSSEQILGELMWLEDLNAEHATVCEPSPSLQGNLLEEFVLDGKICRASMFRTARGTPITVPRMDRMFFVCAGNLLGKIHSTSEKQNKLGKQYRILGKRQREPFTQKNQMSRGAHGQPFGYSLNDAEKYRFQYFNK
jgi:Ser/Thr protein kinase RdoA (MazF antagonist)